MSPHAHDRLLVAVIMPAYNEEEHVGSAIESVPSWVDRIYVVDDASTDGTADAVTAISTREPRVRLVRREENGGVGAATITGYRQAIEDDLDVAVKMDADGQMLGSEVERITGPIRLGLAEYVKGNRFYMIRGSRGMPANRKLGSVALSFMTKMASGYWHVYDSQCGFTAARVDYLGMLDLDALAVDYFFENDMLIRLNSLSARVVDVPTSTLYGPETSGISVPRVLLTFPPRLIVGAVRRVWRKHLVTDFGAQGLLEIAGLALALFGACFGAYHWWLSVATGQVATVGTVMIAVLPLVVGIQLLVQAFAMEVSISPGASETAEYVRRLIAERAL